MAKNAGPLAGQIQRRLILISSWVNAQTRAGRDRTYRDGADVGSANGYLSENLALVGNLFLHVPFEQNLKGLMVSNETALLYSLPVTDPSSPADPQGAACRRSCDAALHPGATLLTLLPFEKSANFAPQQPLLRHIPHDEDAASTTTSPFRPGTRTSSSSRPSDFIASHQLDSNGRPRLDFVAWKETLGQGLAGALHLLQAPVPVDERLEGRWISLVRTRVDELGWYKQEVLDRTTAEDWGSPSSRLAAQRFENVSVLLNNATGWPLDKTFVLASPSARQRHIAPSAAD